MSTAKLCVDSSNFLLQKLDELTVPIYFFNEFPIGLDTSAQGLDELILVRKMLILAQKTLLKVQNLMT